MSSQIPLRPNRRTCHRGFTLAEMMVAVMGASILMAMAMGFYVFGLRSFGAIGNYTDLDSKSRQALDLMLGEIRQASTIGSFTPTGTTRVLTVSSTNAPTYTSTFTWASATRLLTWAKTGQATRTILTGCTDWNFAFYQRAPITNGVFVATANQKRTKLISMSWTCSRTNVFKANTESVVTAEVVLRNLQE